MIDFDDYYKFSDSQEKNALIVDNQDDYCNDEYDLLSGKEQPFKIPVFKPHLGRIVYDVVATTYAILFLFSKTIIDVLDNNNFTGWQTYPIVMLGKNKLEIRNYYGFVVNGKCGPILNDKSKEIMIDSPSGNKIIAWQGLYFDEQYDLSDIFIPQNTGFIIMSSKVKAAFEKANISNARFEKLTEVVRTYI